MNASFWIRHTMIAAVVATTLAVPYVSPCGNRVMQLVVQAAPTVLLMIVAATARSAESRRYRWSIFTALAFSLVGGYYLDVGEFVKGVLGFFLANVAYLTAFTTGVRFAKRLWPFTVLGCTTAAVLAVCWKNIPVQHVVPVCFYSLAITSVAAQAITRSLSVGGVGAAAAAVGATSLLISDSTIGILRYFHDFTGGPLFVMTTYFVGQWLIASGQGGATIVPPDQK